MINGREERNFDGMVQNAKRSIEDGRRQYKSIDEVSLLFASEAQLDEFLAWVQEPRNFAIEHFNSTADTMLREDTDERFGVRFEFCRLVEADWRIEAMCMTGEGVAPLHERVLAHHGNGAVMHLSWKHTTEEIYSSIMSLELQAMLTGRPGVVVGNRDEFKAAYRNSYGRFSYWGTRPYLKPRVNLRDS